MSFPFDFSPEISTLHHFSQQHSLIESSNLAKAVRLYVIVQSIYGVNALTLGTEFTYNKWRNLFFVDAQKIHQRDLKPPLHAPNCPCAKPLRYWLFESYFSIDEPQWKASFLETYNIKPEQLEKLLNEGDLLKEGTRNKLDRGRIFGVTGKTLGGDQSSYDFNRLVALGWLAKKEKNYQKVEHFPEIKLFFPQEYSEIITQPELNTITNVFRNPINGVQRYFIHLDYVPNGKGKDLIGDRQNELYQIWHHNPVPVVKIEYQSKSHGTKGKLIIYPVCIYYHQRAPYLCAWGQTPKRRKIGWYNFRLEGIKQTIQVLNWDDQQIPQELKYKKNNPPQPDEIEGEMSEVWGFDFYEQAQLMLLRFPQEFDHDYIKESYRHRTFKKVSVQQACKLIEKVTQDEAEKKRLLNRVNNYPDDAYYTAQYRDNDNTIIMRLRSWTPNVEVLLPKKLRNHLAIDIYETFLFYQDELKALKMIAD